jgi:hypothetical protein
MERIDPAVKLPDVHREAVARAVARWSSRFGRASTAELEARLVSELAAE